MKKEDAITPIKEEQTYVKDLIERIVLECPQRRPTSQDERRCSSILKKELERLDLEVDLEEFRFNENLYANVALHFGLGSLGTAISGVAPYLAFVLHMLAGLSYWADSTRKGYVLRRLFPFRLSQNVIAKLPAEGGKEPALRVVIIGHADAGLTGLMYNPRVVKLLTGGKLPGILSFMERPLATATRTQFVLAALDLARLALGPAGLALRPLEHLINIPGFLSFVMSAEVALRNEVVPGANDNLSGAAALPVLASRLSGSKHPDVELIFVLSGSEEASLGGADALAKARTSAWRRDRTVIIGLDSLANGELRYLRTEGEVVETPAPQWLIQVVEDAARSRKVEISPFDVPVGGSDVAAFLAHGYDGICLAAIDAELECPRHNHLPSDTPENLDLGQLIRSIDVAEEVVHGVIQRRLGPQE